MHIRLVYVPQDVLWWVLYKAENVLHGSSLRKAALAECMKHIHYEVRRGRVCYHVYVRHVC